MSKFLTSSKDINLINGTADINVNSITATTTNFADGGGGGGGGGGGDKTVETFIQQLASTPADFGKYKLFAKNDGFYERGTGGEVKLTGGVSYAGSVQSNGLNFRNGSDTDKIKNVSGFSLVNLPVIGDSLLCNDIQFPSIYSAQTTINENKTKLTKVFYDGATQLTKIDGDLDVKKIKNTAGTAEVELETDGKINITGDGRVKIRANGTTGTFENALWLESDTNCYITVSEGIFLNAFAPNNTTPNLTLNAVNGFLTIQAINGHIHNKTAGLIRLENIPALGAPPERNGFIFNPDTVRVDLNKLEVSKGHIGLDANENMEIKSATGLNLEGDEVYITSQSGCNNYSLGNNIISAEGYVSLSTYGGDIKFYSNGDNIQFFTNGGSVLCSNVPAVPFDLTNKAYVDSKTTFPFNLIIAGTDEVNLITTTGEKMEIYAPATITLNRVAFSTTQAGGTNFTVGVYQNGTLIKQMILGGISYSDQAITPITITKGDIIHLKVIDVGLSTGTGLKCYLEGVYQ